MTLGFLHVTWCRSKHRLLAFQNWGPKLQQVKVGNLLCRYKSHRYAHMCLVFLENHLTCNLQLTFTFLLWVQFRVSVLKNYSYEYTLFFLYSKICAVQVFLFKQISMLFLYYLLVLICFASFHLIVERNVAQACLFVSFFFSLCWPAEGIVTPETHFFSLRESIVLLLVEFVQYLYLFEFVPSLYNI